jgi:tetratricopeptide (TPR) repeat protein
MNTALVAGTDRDFKYRVFISYSHSDNKWARWLHRALETYKLPRGAARGAVADGRQKPLSPVFRDREDLSSAANLSDAVSLALEDSANLVVICSPGAARSRWVNEEILTFKRLGRSGRIFCLIVDGEPHGPGETGCFPEALRYEWADDGLSDVPAEPLAADARRSGDGRSLAKLKLIAGMLDVDLDDLRQRDLQRRNRRLLAVTAGSAAVAVLTVSLAIMAFLSDAEAQRRRAQAEDLIGFMVGDLHQRLQEIGRLDVFMSVGNKAMEYFSSLPDEDVDNKVLRQRAEVLSQIGNTRLDQAELAAALESFREASAISLRLANTDPSNTDWQIALANSYFWIGLVHWQRGELQAAGDEFQKVIPIVNRVAQLEPGNPEWLAEKGYAYTNLARVLELRGELERALDLYREIAAINDQMLALEPDNVDYQLEVGFAHNNIGKVVQSLGRLEEAAGHFKADLEIKQAISDSDPNNNLWRVYLATSHQYLGRNAMPRGEYDMARDAFSSAVELVAILYRLDPENTDRRERLATYYRELAAVEIQRLRLDAANVALDESSKLWSGLLRSDEKKWSWRAGAGQTGIYQAWLALVKDDGEGARAYSSEATAVFEELRDRDPSNLEALKNLVLAGLVAGDALAATGSRQSAIEAWEEALTNLGAAPANGRIPELIELSAALRLRLGQDGQARADLDSLDAMGYHHQFVSLPGTGKAKTGE